MLEWTPAKQLDHHTSSNKFQDADSVGMTSLQGGLQPVR